MPYHQLVVELPASELARAEEACTGLGAIAVSLADAGDEPLLQPAPGETPVWRAVRLRALFDISANPEITAATLAVVLGLTADAIAVEHVEDRVWEREWLKDFRPMRFGRRLWVAPAGQRPDGVAPVVLELDPGLAFAPRMHRDHGTLPRMAGRSNTGRRARSGLRLRFGDSRAGRPQAGRRVGFGLRH